MDKPSKRSDTRQASRDGGRSDGNRGSILVELEGTETLRQVGSGQHSMPMRHEVHFNEKRDDGDQGRKHR